MISIKNSYVEPKIRYNSNLERTHSGISDFKKQTDLSFMPCYRPSFSSGNLKFIYDSQSIDYDKLDGIQSGIPVFEGLNIAQIVFLSRRLSSVMVTRGCKNNCVHCFADAKAPMHLKTEDDKKTKINKISYDDFSSLTKGFKELNKRLGGTLFKQSADYQALFYDSDSIDTLLIDKKGKIHDYIDLAEQLYKATGVPQIFDTAGWSPKDKNAQNRAEKYAKYFSKPKHMEMMRSFNVSLNPFHAMNARYVEYIKSDPQRANKFRELYTDRMANVIYTFTPLLLDPKFSFLTRAMDNNGHEGYSKEDLAELIDEISSKLLKLYEKDLASDKKFVKDFGDVFDMINIFELKSQDISTLRVAQGRIEKLLKKDDDMFVGKKENFEKFDTAQKALHSKDFEAIIDSNGKVYLTDFVMTYPTDIQMNFKNKDKTTAPIAPDLQDEIINKEMIKTYLAKV